MKGGGLGGLGGEEQSCGCMWIELENMPNDTSNTFGTLGSLLFMYILYPILLDSFYEIVYVVPTFF